MKRGAQRAVAVLLAMAAAVGLAAFAMRAGMATIRGDAAGRAAFTLSGEVRSLEGAPLAGARVELFAVDEAQVFTRLAVAATDGAARFALPFSPPAGGEHLLLVRASASGYASESRTVESENRTIELRLAGDPASAEVLVEAAPDAPSAGASVLVTFEPVAAPAHALYAWRTVTDERGRARFEGLPPLPGTLHVFAEDEAGRAFRKIAKEAGPHTTSVRIAIERGRAATVRLVASEPGGPEGLASAEIVLREAEGPWRAGLRPDAAGAARIENAPAGAELLAEVGGGWVLADGAAAVPWTIAPAAAAPAELSLRVKPAGSLEGVVVDEHGQPVRAASVTLAPEGQGASAPRRLTTDGRGRFAFTGLTRSARWSIAAQHPDHAPVRPFSVATGARDVRLTLRDGGALVGRVIDRRGRGIAGVEIYAHAMQQRGQTLEGLPEYAAVITGEDGRYRLGRLNPGRYRFEARPPARMQWQSIAAVVQEHEVKEGDHALPDLTLSRGAVLAGLVPAAAAGAAVAESIEVAILPDGQEGVPHRVSAQPDAAGRFEVAELEAGSYRVRVHARSRGWSEPVVVALREDERGEATFRFAGSAVLAGKLELDGAVPRGARVDVYGERTAERAAHDLSGNWAAVAEDGSFAVRGLASGDVTVRITSDESAPLVMPLRLGEGTTRRAFALSRGDTVEVALRSADGTAARAGAGKIVLLEPADDRPLGVALQAIADGDGVARFERVPRGSYQARAVLPGMPRAQVSSQQGRVELTVP